MPRSAVQNTAIRDAARRQLLDAASHVFVRVGYAAARMTEIAQEARLSHGLTYHYFQSKEAIFIAVVKSAFEGMDRLVETTAEESREPMSRLRTICRHMLERVRERPALPLIMIQVSSSAAAPARARAMLRRSSRRFVDALAALIADAQHLGQAGDGEPRLLAHILLATINGLAVDATFGPRLVAKQDPVDVVMRLIRPEMGRTA